MTQETPIPWTPDEQVCPRCETDLYVGRYKGTDKIDYKCHKCGWSE